MEGAASPALGLALARVARAEADRQRGKEFGRVGQMTLGRALLRAEVWQAAESALGEARALCLESEKHADAAVCEWAAGVALRMQDRLDEARACFRRAEPALRVAGRELEAARCRRDWAILLNLRAQFERALSKLKSARRTFYRAGAAGDLALCDVVEGAGLANQGRHAEALRLYVSAVVTLREAGLLPDSVRALWMAGQEKYYLDEFEASLQMLQRAADELLALGWEFRAALAMQDQGLALWATGRLEEAAETFLSAIPIHERVNPGHRAISICRYNAGYMYLNLGRLDKAEAEFRLAQPRLNELADDRQEGSCWQGLGQIARARGELDLSRRHFERARGFFQQAQAADFESSAILDLADLLRKVNQVEEARSLLNEVLDEPADRFPPAARTEAFLQMGEVERSAGAPDSAWRYFQQAEALAREANAEQLLARSQYLLAESLADAGRWPEASEPGRLARESFAGRGFFFWRIRSDLLLARIERGLGEPEKAREILREALAALGSSDPDLKAQACLEMALTQEEAGELDDARGQVREGIRAQRRARRSLTRAEWVSGYQTRHAELFQAGFRLGLKAGALKTRKADPWLLWLGEESRAQDLLARLSQWRGTHGTTASREENRLRRRIETLEAQKRALEMVAEGRLSIAQGMGRAADRSGNEGTTPDDRLRQTLEELDRTWERVETLRRAGAVPRLDAGEFALDQFLAVARRHFPARWQALIYHWLDDGPLVLRLAADGLTHYRPRVNAKLAALVQTLRPGQLPGGDSAAAEKILAQLSIWLLPPNLNRSLRPDSLLLILPSGPLNYLPFHALSLPDGARLIRRTVVSYAPSLQSVVALAERGAQVSSSGDILAVGYAGEEAQSTPLKRMDAEIQVLRDCAGDRLEEYVDARATLDRLRKLNRRGGLRRFEYLHFVAHGRFDSEFQRASGLQLAGDVLTAHAAADLDLAARAVTLAVCDSLARDVLAVDEWIGLPVSFLAAGAQSVVGALWPIPDQVGPETARGMCRGLLNGEGPAFALARVQRAQLRRSLSLKAWAGMAVLGLP